MNQELKIVVGEHEVKGRIVITIQPSGQFMEHTTPNFKKVWDKQVSRQPQIIGINCKNITDIDSTAIGFMANCIRQARKKNIEVVLYDLSEVVEYFFKLKNITQFLNIMTKFNFEAQYLI